MIRILLFYLLILSPYIYSQTPVKFWENQTIEEKVAFVNGAYAAIYKIKNHHQVEVRKQYVHDKNWIEPYYIKRFYDIADEYLSSEVGYNLKIIVMHIDAFYTNSDNYNIPILEALRIVSLIQDGDNKRANLRLLKAQRTYAK
tara:strand:- start:100629 stop:101057 length:429 start_codon:yes stop_codon:yes gene_type:complete